MQALPLEEKIAIAQKVIQEFVDHFGVDGVYISFSGGKDSTVLIDLCRRIYPELTGLYSDGDDDDLLRGYLVAAISYAESYQHISAGSYTAKLAKGSFPAS